MSKRFVEPVEHPETGYPKRLGRPPEPGLSVHEDFEVDVHQLKAEMCRRDFFYFVQEFWDEVIPAAPIWNWHIEYLCGILQDICLGIMGKGPDRRDLVVNVPPGTTKSTLFSVMLPAWAWTVDPTMRILTVSYAYTLSIDLCIKTRDILRSDKFQAYFPDVKIKVDQSGKSHYKNTSKGERMATSIGGSITGFHAHLIIIDDPMNAVDALSEASREAAAEFMDRALSTRKVDKAKTRTLMVMQRLHTGDPTGHWLSYRKDVDHICLPGIATDSVYPKSLLKHYRRQGGFLDPVRMGEKVLEDLKQSLGTYGYSGQILQEPVPVDGAIFKPSYFVPIKRKDIPENLKRVGTDWDLAYTSKQTNSASAWVTAGVHDKKMYVTDCGAAWKEFPQLIALIKSKNTAPYIEAKASGKSAVQTLKQQGIPAIEVQVRGGIDKVARATLASPYCEAGLVYVAEDLMDYLLFDMKQGLTRFPGGLHDDLADAMVQSINRLLCKPKVIVI